MTSLATLVWMLLAIGAGLGLFVLKYEVQAMEERLVSINRQTLRDFESIHVLKAEWNYLNRPSRLEDLASRLLSLGPVTALQSVSIRDIPFRPNGRRQTAPLAPLPRVGDLPPPLLAKLRRAP